MSETVIFLVGIAVFAITVYGSVIACLCDHCLRRGDSRRHRLDTCRNRTGSSAEKRSEKGTARQAAAKVEVLAKQLGRPCSMLRCRSCQIARSRVLCTTGSGIK